MLDVRLKERGFTLSALSSSKGDWAHLFRTVEGSQRTAIETLLSTAREVDKAIGSDLLAYVRNNITRDRITWY